MQGKRNRKMNETIQVGYKVVTGDLKSLGLRKNPNILEFKINEWFYLPRKDIEEGEKDWGGIWVARTLSNAKKLKDYMKNKYNKETRIFKTALDKILYLNSYRIKTNGIKLVEEIFIYSPSNFIKE